MNDFSEFLNVLIKLGVPTIGAMTVWCIRACLHFTKELKIIREAIQSNMRKDLLKEYKQYKSQGYVEDDDLQEWENRYQKYHLLAENGIMDAKRQELLMLPNTPPVGRY